MRPTDLCFDLVRKLPPDVQAKLASVPGWDRYSDPENGPPRLVEAGCEVPADPLDIVRVAAEGVDLPDWGIRFDPLRKPERPHLTAYIMGHGRGDSESPHEAALLLLCRVLGRGPEEGSRG